MRRAMKERCYFNTTAYGFANSRDEQNRQKMLGLIFSEKQVFSNNTFQTMQPNDILTLLCSGGESFKVFKKEKSSDNTAQSCLVTSSGFKPETF